MSSDVAKAIHKGRVTYPDYALLSAEAKHLIERLLQVDPAKRFTAKQALQHPWIVHAHKQPTPTITRPRVGCHVVGERQLEAASSVCGAGPEQKHDVDMAHDVSGVRAGGLSGSVTAWVRNMLKTVAELTAHISPAGGQAAGSGMPSINSMVLGV